MSDKIHICECSNVATIFDSTGWHWAECERAIRNALESLNKYIYAKRAEEPDRFEMRKQNQKRNYENQKARERVRASVDNRPWA